jgi:general secretion pathway protein C
MLQLEPMGLRGLRIKLKEHFWLVVVTLLLPSAYLQAKGVSFLVGAYLFSHRARSSAAAASSAQPKGVAVREPTAAAILARNPFDSVTGPLDGPLPSAKPEPKLDLSDPLRAPECEGVRAESTVESSDPLWSSAVVQAPDDAHGKVRRVGQAVGDKRVAFIGFNVIEQSPAVWLVSDSELCQALVFSDQKTKASKKKVSTERRRKRKASRQRRKARGKRAPRLPAAIAKKIRRVGPTEYVVDRSAVDALLENQSILMRSVRIKPRKSKAGASLELSRVRRGSLLAHIGLKRGDRIEAINGYSLASPEKALEAYARLRTASNLRLDLRRGRKSMTMEYRIQ